ncbi:hypothetical protein ACLUXQ_08945 [Limosilactobacillus mucosae]
MHLKKVLATVASFGLMLSLAACGNKQTVSTSSSSKSASVSSKTIESSSAKSQGKKYSESQYAMMAYLKSAKKEGTNTGSQAVQVTTNNNLKREFSDSQGQYTVTNTAKKVTVKSSDASYVFSKDQLTKSLQKNIENVNELLDKNTESTDNSSSSSTSAKESKTAESSSSSSLSASSSSNSQSTAKMTAADAKAMLKEHVSAEREKAGLSGQSVSGMPTADDVDGLTMNQSADGNWTATGTINGQTVTYNITPSQVSSN